MSGPSLHQTDTTTQPDNKRKEAMTGFSGSKIVSLAAWREGSDGHGRSRGSHRPRPGRP